MAGNCLCMHHNDQNPFSQLNIKKCSEMINKTIFCCESFVLGVVIWTWFAYFRLLLYCFSSKNQLWFRSTKKEFAFVLVALLPSLIENPKGTECISSDKFFERKKKRYETKHKEWNLDKEMVLIDTALRFSIKFKEISDTPSLNIFQAKLHKILIVSFRSTRERLFFLYILNFNFETKKNAQISLKESLHHPCYIAS